MNDTADSRAFASDFVGYMNEACTAFHAVEASRARLLARGFVEVDERDAWALFRGGKYFFVRNTTTLIAFAIGGKYEAGNGYTVLGAHTDSPCLRLKPVPCLKKNEYLMLNTQPYGGGLWHTWFDRDLGIAGRVVLNGSNGLESRLVRIDEPVARIPNLAIHLTSGKERESFEPNLHEHAKAILTHVPTNVDFSDATLAEDTKARLNPFLLALVAKQLDVPAASIADMELQLIDVQPSCVGGASGEFIFSGRHDNLCSAYQCVRAITDECDATLADATNVRMIMLFDHEEVGSASCTGAGSSLFMNTLQLINQCLTDGTPSALMRSLRKSFVVSIDMAHGLHPNYPAKHDSTMAPKVNLGLVIKHNANQVGTRSLPLLPLRVLTLSLSLSHSQTAAIRHQCSERVALPRLRQGRGRARAGVHRAQRRRLRLHHRTRHRHALRHPHRRLRLPAVQHALDPGDDGRLRRVQRLPRAEGRAAAPPGLGALRQRTQLDSSASENSRGSG